MGTWGGLGPEGAKVLSRILKHITAREEPSEKGPAQRLNIERIGAALFRQVFKLLDAKNYLL